MDFKNRKIDGLALMADLVSREAGDRSVSLAAALRRIEIVEDGRYGQARPDIRLTVALAPGLEAAVDHRWQGQDASLSELVDGVGELVDAVERIFDDRDCTVEMLREVRAKLSREVSKARRRGLPYRTLDVSLTPSEAGSDDLPAALVGIEIIGPLLAAERFAFDAETADDVVRVFADLREKQERLLQLREQLARLGADVAIDSVTLAALKDAGVAPAQAVADLRDSGINIIDIETRHGQLVLYVRDGVVTGNVPLGEEMRWQEGRLTTPKARGVSAEHAKGKALNRLVPHAYLGDGLSVYHASEIGDELWFRVLPRPVGVNLEEVKRAA